MNLHASVVHRVLRFCSPSSCGPGNPRDLRALRASVVHNGTVVLALVLSLLFALGGRAWASGVDPTKISLPKGPGSIEGLGRNFEPSLASGTAAYGLDIAVPPAVGGFGPKLGLDYDSGGGISELGLGWKLGGIPRIRRRTENGLPRFNETDQFELMGLGIPCDLLEVSPGVFRPEHEAGTFVRVKRSQDGKTWEARVKSGMTYRFGGNEYTEAEGTRVASWLLREQLDLHGHSIRYDWDTSLGYALLQRVVWNDLSATARNEILIQYEERPDVHERYSSGIREFLDKRVSTIEVRHGGQLVRRYRLGYGSGSHSQLETVTMVGADGTTALPTLTLAYTKASFAADGQITSMQEPPGRSPKEGDVSLADLNGDGLPDLLVAVAGQYRSYVNRDGIRWDPATAWPVGQSPSVSLSTAGVQLADVDGDGAIDLLVKSGTTDFRYFPGKDATAFEAPVAIGSVPSFTFEDPDVRLADMDGDRRVDVVITTAAGLAIGYNVDGKEWREPEVVGVIDPNQVLRFSDGRTQLCDVNGDRVQDFCYLRSGSLTYWLGRGRGEFEAPQQGSGVPTFDDSAPWKLHDLDGDGWVDLVHAGVTQVEYALATQAGAFGAVRAIEGTPTKSSTTAVEFADINGSGTTDIVWVDPTLGAEQAWRYLELFPDGRGGLLRRIENGLGRVIRVEYDTAAQQAAQAREEGEPWSSRINVPMAVVRRVEVDSSLGDPVLATEYTYRDGVWDPQQRTFAAFTAGVQRQIGDEYTPTLLNESRFEPGLEVRVLRGSEIWSEQRDETGQVFARSTTGYQKQLLETATDGRRVVYGYQSYQRVEHVEGDESAKRETLTEWEQDRLGNIVKESRWGEVVGDDRLAGDDEAITLRTFAGDEQEWVLGYLATEEVTNAAGERVSLRRNYYDGEPFEGLPLGRVVRGDLVRVEEWVDAERFVATTSEFDKHGNETAILNARGARTEIGFDSSHTFVVLEKTFPRSGQTIEWTAEYDGRFGAITKRTDPNGNLVQVGYDELGRVTWIVKPGDTKELPSERMTYDARSPLSTVRTTTRVRSSDPEVREKVNLFDGLGRSRGSFEQAADSGWVLTERTLYDARGNRFFEAQPSFEPDLQLPSIEGMLGMHTFRDATARDVGVRHSDGASTRIEYRPLSRTLWDENDTDSSGPHRDTPTTREYDGVDRLTRVIERDGVRSLASAIYAYDAAGRLIRRTDAEGNTDTYGYDGRGLRVRIDDVNAGSWEMTYTDTGKIETRTDPTGRIVRFEYDLVDRITEEWHQLPGAPLEIAVRYHFDEASPSHPEFAGVVGQLAWVEDQGGSVYFGYDERGRRLRETRRWVDGTEHGTAVTLDAVDQVVARTYPDGSVLTMSYDRRGKLAAIGPVVTELTWAPSGKLERMKLGNGVVDQRHYDARLRPARLEAVGPNNESLRDLSYSLDPASRVTAIKDRRAAVPKELDLSVKLGLDARNRVVSVEDAASATHFVLDDLARVTDVSSGHSEPWMNIHNSYGEGTARPSQLTSAGSEKFSYDEAGRLVKDGERTLVWDAVGRLAEVRRGDLVERYTYGYDNTRVAKQAESRGVTSETRYIARDAELRDGQLVRYVYLGDERIALLDPLTSTMSSGGPAPGGGSSTRVPMLAVWTALLALIALLLAKITIRSSRAMSHRWVLGVALAAALAPGCGDSDSKGASSPPSSAIAELPPNAVFFLNDLAGTPVTTLDAHGATVHQASYHAYGALRAQAGQGAAPFGFVGNERDEGSGLHDFKARPYRAEAWAFLAPDPVPLHEPERALEDPAKAYPYVYAAANPYTSADRSGQVADIVVDVFFISYDLTTLLMDNVVDGRTDNLGLNLAVLGVDVACAVVPFATGGGLAVRGGAHVSSKPGVVMMHAGSKRATQVVAHAPAPKTYQTYTKTNSNTGQVYSGRTSGTGTARENVANRDRNHHMNEQGYGPAKLDKSSSTPSPIRGREQQLIQHHGGARSQGGSSGNAINGIGATNPRSPGYFEAAIKEFGRFAPL